MDHEGLKWFPNNKQLNRRQAWWALELDGFEFQIIHRPGVKMASLMLCVGFRSSPMKRGCKASSRLNVYLNLDNGSKMITVKIQKE